MKKQLSFTALLLIVLFSNNIYSQWSTDPTVNNPICTQASTEERPAITGDGSGGAIITWEDNRNGNFDIYAQSVNSNGVVQWTADGLAVCTQASSQTYASITSDGSGGAIITWQDSRHGNPTIYAQRIDATGTPQWTDAATGGIAISILSTGQWAPTITGDGSGRAIITWYDYRNNNNDIYAQRINANGVVQWTANGLAVCTQASHQYNPTITSDGSSGAIITWYEDRIGNNDIYAQRINSSGTPQWSTAVEGGVAICTNAIRQDDPTIASDGSGGAIITWQDSRSANTDIYSQRINSSGVAQWTTDGLAVCTLTSGQYFPDISSDGSGGAIIAWADARNATFYDIYAQRINSSGTPQWVSDGIAISTVGGKATYPVITGDASGGIIAWRDTRNVNSDIYASKASPDGALPVELVSFSGQLNENSVNLVWQTASEVNNYGFEVQKSEVREQKPGWQRIGFVNGHCSSNSVKEYSYLDKDVAFGKYSYRLKQIDNDGAYEYSNEVEVDFEMPAEFSLNQNYPNPFNPTTTIEYQLPIDSKVNLIVYDILGREIKVLINEEKNPGSYEVVFDARELASGIYFYAIRAGAFTQNRKMILMK